MPSTTVADAVIFSKRPELVKAAGDALRMKGVSNIMTPTTSEDAIDALTRFKSALLIIDNEIGAAPLARVLGQNRAKAEFSGRPILLVAQAVSESLVATAAEYNVTQIFADAVTVKNISGRLAALIISESVPNEIKQGLADAGEARQNGRFKEAFAVLQKLLPKHPSNQRLKNEAAEVLIALGEGEKATKILENIENSKPPNLRGINIKARALLLLKKFDEATALLESANILNPNDCDRLIDLGNALLGSDRVAEAERAFDRAMSVDPDSHDAKVGKGKCLLLESQVNEALSLLREVSGDTEIASVFNMAAIMNMRKGRHEQGMSLYQSALNSLSRNPKIQSRLWFNMGLGYVRWGKRDKSKSCFETATKLDPHFRKASVHLADLAKPASKPVPAANQQLAGNFNFDDDDDVDVFQDISEEDLFNTKSEDD